MIGHLTLAAMIISASLVVATLAVAVGYAFVPAFLLNCAALSFATVVAIVVDALS